MKGQISAGGIPLSISHPETFSGQFIPSYSLPVPNIAALLAEDEDRDRNEFNLRDAVAVPVNKGLEQGAWTNHDDGSRTWRMALKVNAAFSLEVNFDDLFIPDGGRMFVFNMQGTEYHGAYTSQNNKSSGKMSVEMVQGEEVIIEYFEPAERLGLGRVHVQDLAYRYRDVLGMSQSCEVDVACVTLPALQEVAKSVVKIRTRINGQFYWCSGTLMNNTAQDCSPFILTSMRCGLENGTFSTSGDFNLYRFYFNYGRSGCSNGPVNLGMSIAGCTELGNSHDNGGAFGSDYMLLELSNSIPLSYNAYYAGWSNSKSLPIGDGSCIHHPSGDVKKISINQGNVETGNWGQADSHWKVTWSSTEVGHGVTEAGSSGAPFFDGNGRVIGTLTGGSSYCSNVLPGGENQPDFFGKMSWHWNDNPNPPNEKLHVFLDPNNSGTVTLDGSFNPCLAVGISENEIPQLLIYPNPTEGVVRINYDTSQEMPNIQVTDISGKLIPSERLNRSSSDQTILLDFSSLENGVYVIFSNQSDGAVSVQRIVLNR